MRRVHMFMFVAALALWGACATDRPDGSEEYGGDAVPSVHAVPREGAAFTATLRGLDLKAAYRLPGIQCSASTVIAVVAAGGYPNAMVDQLANRSHNGLSGATFTVMNQNGSTNPALLPGSISTSWEFAHATGIQLASDLCDAAQVIDIQAASAAIADLKAATQRAKLAGAKRVVLTFASTIDQGDAAFISGADYFVGIDVGGAITWPSMSGLVTTVVPTALQPDTSLRGFAETVSLGAAGGCSARSKPSFQTDSVCPSNRTVGDMAAIGDSSTPVEVYYGGAVFLVSGPAVSAGVAAGWFGGDTAATLQRLYIAAPSQFFTLPAPPAFVLHGSPNGTATF
jgi:hypothetical protein